MFNLWNKREDFDIARNKIKYSFLKKRAQKQKSIIFFDNILSSKTRLIISNFFLILTIFFLILSIKDSGIFNIILEKNDKEAVFSQIKKYLNNDSFYFALFLISFSFLLILKSFRAFLFSDIFSNKTISFDIARIILDNGFFKKTDNVEIFLKSKFGKEVIKRLFLDQNKIDTFLEEKNKFIFSDDYVFIKNNIEEKRISSEINVTDYVQALYENDEEFASFLSINEVTKEDILKVTSWVSKKHYNYKNKKRWWSKKKLANFGQIGTALSYGQTFILDKFAIKISTKKTIFGETAFENYEDDIKKLERVLIKDGNNNAFVVSESYALSVELLKALESKIKAGESYRRLERSRVYVLESLLLLESTGNNFEKFFLKLLNEAVESGNVILVFNDFYAFYEKAKTVNIDVLAIIKSYFNSDLSFIILSDQKNYKSFLQTNSYVKEYFDIILTQQESSEMLLFILQNKILSLERENNILFSFRALEYLFNATKNFFPNDVISEKFLTILEEFIVFQKTRGLNKAGRTDAKFFMEKKTGTTQVITKEVKENMLSLEKELHKRVIGQDEAINAIADAIRRSVSGVGSRKKPIASFLFIGSTGVGKTETAKALAETYFGDQEKMLRFDMSEYSTGEAIANFLGSTYTNKKGSLFRVASLYKSSLMLFDELEKSSKEIHDLFLQILDEGQIKDAFGDKINFKNNIIIATTNAGSRLIYENNLRNLNSENKKQKIIDYIIGNKIFRPEFLNRFDKIVLFQKLKKDEIKKIAGLQLKSLVKRLKKESYDFVVTDSIKDYLANKGRTEMFGARETNRIIKDEIESFISKEILKENIKKGDKFVINQRINENGVSEIFIEVIK